MYISLNQIKQSLEALEPIHPFFGITFLAFKYGKVPVGDAIDFHADAKELEFMEKYYKPEKSSKYFYRVFRPSNKAQRWLREDYPSSGSQSTRTKRGFAEAFIHDRDTAIWGWKIDYVEHLKAQLRNRQKVPSFHLAVWLYRDREWATTATAESILERFREEFMLTPTELEGLYSPNVPQEVDKSALFVDRIVTWRDLRSLIGNPPDANQEEGGTLTYMGLRAIGPVAHAELSLGERLNLVTGDNGLGKTFLLECIWWALTGQWAGLPAHPSEKAKVGEPKIIFEMSAESTRPERTSVTFNWQTMSWPTPKRRPTIPGLLVYARVDGSFAVWDPARELWASSALRKDIENGRPFVITKDQVWNGLEEKWAGKTRTYINGLIRDWTTWQNNPDRYPFETFRRVLQHLSPVDLGPLKPGKPTRLPGDAREIPTIRHSYGEVPILYAAAGVGRIIALAYLIVWAWEEHRVQSDLLRKKPQRRMVIMVDEVEAHLHPKWQRSILPALIDLGDELSSELSVQFLVATHSPLTLLSLESIFDEEVDRLFHFYLQDKERDQPKILLQEMRFSKHGRVDTWLTSEVFDLKQARSEDAEKTIESAKALQLQEDPKVEDVRRVTNELLKLLPSDDDFWPRWKYFAENRGVEL